MQFKPKGPSSPPPFLLLSSSALFPLLLKCCVPYSFGLIFIWNDPSGIFQSQCLWAESPKRVAIWIWKGFTQAIPLSELFLRLITARYTTTPHKNQQTRNAQETQNIYKPQGPYDDDDWRFYNKPAAITYWLKNYKVSLAMAKQTLTLSLSPHIF